MSEIAPPFRLTLHLDFFLLIEKFKTLNPSRLGKCRVEHPGSTASGPPREIVKPKFSTIRVHRPMVAIRIRSLPIPQLVSKRRDLNNDVVWLVLKTLSNNTCYVGSTISCHLAGILSKISFCATHQPTAALRTVTEKAIVLAGSCSLDLV